MKVKGIDEIREFRAVADPLCSLQKEMSDNNRRKDEPRAELSSLFVDNQQQDADAWNSYLDLSSPQVQAKRDELRQELGRLESRQEFLRHAGEKGQEAAELLRARLSIPVCDGEGRRACLSAIKSILCAIRQIWEANTELKRICEMIEGKGYKTGRLPVAMFDLGGE